MPGFYCPKCKAVANHQVVCSGCGVPMQPDNTPPPFVFGSNPVVTQPKPLVLRFKMPVPQGTPSVSPFGLLPSPPQITTPVIIPVAKQKLRIIHFDVSQGESSLISYTDETAGTAKHVLIDGGRQGRGVYVRRCLEKLKVRHLDYVICTHADNDHYEGLFSVAISKKIKIGKMLLSHDGWYEEYTKKYESIQQQCMDLDIDCEVAKTGTLIQEGPFTLEIKYVGRPKDKEGNHASIACLVSMNSFRYYTAGDLPSDIEDTLLGQNHVCAFKCGHHGSAGSTSQDFVRDISPTVGFLSAGRHGHGHPHQPVLDNLIGQGSVQRFYSTQCIPVRTGFGTGAKGVVAARRKSGILGHLVLYTDNLLSNLHGNDAVNFQVFVSRSNYGGWRRFDHACGKTGIPAEINPLNLPVPMPEMMLSQLSTTVDDFPLFWQQLRTDAPPQQPKSPVRYFLEDEENFTLDNSKTGRVKRKWQESEHIAAEKALSTCFLCSSKNTVVINKKKRLNNSKSTVTVECSHGVSFYLCYDCFSDEYDEDESRLQNVRDSRLCGGQS